MSIPVGVYVLSNVASSTVMDLSNGNSANGTHVQGWQMLSFDSVYAFDQYWFIQPVPGSHDTYTLYNLKAGTVLELSNGNSANGTQAQCWARVADPSDPAIHNQEWHIVPLPGGSAYRLVNVRAKTSLDLSNGGTANGTKLQGWVSEDKNPNQEWHLQRRTTPEGA